MTYFQDNLWLVIGTGIATFLIPLLFLQTQYTGSGSPDTLDYVPPRKLTQREKKITLGIAYPICILIAILILINVENHHRNSEKDLSGAGTSFQNDILIDGGERKFLYLQLLDRKKVLEEELVKQAEEKNIEQVKKISETITEIEEQMKKLKYTSRITTKT